MDYNGYSTDDFDDIPGLPGPVPDGGSTESDAEDELRKTLVRHTQEVLQQVVAGIDPEGGGLNTVRALSLLESYATSTRTILADLGEMPSPKRRRGLEVGGGLGFPMLGGGGGTEAAFMGELVEAAHGD